jgi:predicted nucleic acid-binding protein
MSSGIIDSSILIDCLRGRTDAIAFLAAQIAATAQRMGVEVFTQNVKHFTAFPGLRVVRAY